MSSAASTGVTTLQERLAAVTTRYASFRQEVDGLPVFRMGSVVILAALADQLDELGAGVAMAPCDVFCFIASSMGGCPHDNVHEPYADFTWRNEEGATCALLEYRPPVQYHGRWTVFARSREAWVPMIAPRTYTSYQRAKSSTDYQRRFVVGGPSVVMAAPLPR